MKHVTPTLTQVTQYGLINAYLVQEDDGLTLIDALNPKAERRILAAAESLGAPIKRIAITHAHPDHVGALDALVAALPDAELIVGRREALPLAADRTPQPGEPTDGRFLGGPVKVSSTPTRLVDAGDHVGSLRVVDAPGHSQGQIAFLDERDQTLICGDAYSTVGGVATTAGPYWRFPLPGFVTWHRPTALESARALRALQPARLAPGHGSVVEDPGAAMDRAIAKRSK
ncbi:MAG: MBL fold metallo-hydrolase [Solirubrobacteraceae bacterium]|nr:MBL fold metallo-hydrolase [Solirubrobacteraceae bacterium]